MKKLIRILQLILLVVYFPVVMAFVSSENSRQVCSRVQTKVFGSEEDALISKAGLQSLVQRRFPKLDGALLSDLNKNDMESLVEKNPVVKCCEVFSTPGGVLHVTVTQREPVLRVFEGNDSYYLDEEGYHIPVFVNHAARVLVANGHISALPGDSVLIAMAEYIRSTRFWNAQIEQIYINEKGEFVLVPRVGSHLILFGDIDDMEEKFDKLKALYQQGWEPREWNYYKTVNLKYKGQIVCTKANDI